MVTECSPGLELSEHLSIKHQILNALDELGSATASEVAEAVEIELSAVKPAISMLKKDKKIMNTSEKDGRAHIYTLANKDNAAPSNENS